MTAGLLSYCGKADLTLVYDQSPALGHVIERAGIQVVVTRHNATASVSVLVDRRLGVAESNGLPLCRAAVVLLDGSVLSGPVQEIGESGDYFEIAAGSPASQGSDRYA